MKSRTGLARKGCAPEAAAGPEREAALRRPAALRVGADVVDRHLRAVERAALDGDLELARQREVERIEEEVVVDGEDVGCDVERLVWMDARIGAARDVANAVGAGAARADADGEQRLVHVDDLLERHPVDLDVLARRDVRDAAAIAVGDVGHDVELLRGEQAPGNLDALHVAGVVELVVQAVGEPDGAPGVGGDLTALIPGQPIGMAGEGFTLLLQGRRHDRIHASMGARFR